MQLRQGDATGLEQSIDALVSPLGHSPSRSSPGRTIDRCAAGKQYYEARLYPREGDERLSASKRNESKRAAADGTDLDKASASGRGGRKQRSSDVGRALRTTYDDTLREPVPDDFLALIGKLS
jgi:hypothetical protein